MLTVVREYHLSVMRPCDRDNFELTGATISISAEGPFAEANGAVETLALLTEKIQPWVKNNWNRRWVISTPAELKRARDKEVRHARCPLGGTPAEMAEYLLLGVFEPMFRHEGLLVKAVEVAVGLDRGSAKIEQPIAIQYEDEMVKGAQAATRAKQPSTDFSLRQAIPNLGFGNKNRFSAYDHNKGVSAPRR